MSIWKLIEALTEMADEAKYQRCIAGIEDVIFVLEECLVHDDISAMRKCIRNAISVARELKQVVVYGRRAKEPETE